MKKPAPKWFVPIEDGSGPALAEIRDSVVPPCVLIDLGQRSRLMTPMEAAQLGQALQAASREAAARRKR